MRKADEYLFLLGEAGRSPSLLARVLAVLAGIAVLVISVFVGAIVIAAAMGFLLLAVLLVTARGWWLRRQMRKYRQQHGDLEAEYTVIEERRIDR